MNNIVLINLFWLSIPFIGYAAILFASRTKNNQLKNIATVLLRLPLPSLFLASFTIPILLFCLLCIPMYLFQIHVNVAVGVYSVLLLTSLLYVIKKYIRRYANYFINDRPINLRHFGKATYISASVLILFVGVLLVDFIISLYTKAFIGGDAIFHMSRVVSIINDGFNLRTSFFDNLPENAYHFNVIYVLYAIASKVLRLSPMEVWEYSLSFFRLVIWFSIYSLAFYVGKCFMRFSLKMNFVFSAMSTVATVLIFSSVFFIGSYPSQLAVAWAILAIIMATETLKGTRYANIGLLSLSVLLTMTHAIWAFMIAAMLIYLVVVNFLLRLLLNDNKKYHLGNVWIVIGAAIMLVSPIITLVLPDRSSYEHINLPGAKTTLDVLGFTIRDPNIVFNISAVPSIGFFLAIIGIISFFYLVWHIRKNRYALSMIISVNTLFVIVLFVPPVFWMMKKVLPVWTLDRFVLSNILIYIAPGIVSLIIATAIRRTMRHIDFNRVKIPETLLFAIIALVISLPFSQKSYGEFTKYTNDKQEAYVGSRVVSNDFAGILKNNKVVISDLENSFYLAARFNIDVVAVSYGHMPLSADGKNRLDCLKGILDSYDRGDLNAVRADYIVVPTNEDGVRILPKLAPLSYVKLVAEDQYFFVFEVEHNGAKTPKHTSCIEFEKRESKP